MDRFYFEKDALELLIDCTFEFNRDFSRCAKNAVLRAKMRNSNNMTIEDAQVSLDELKSELNCRYTQDCIPTLEKIIRCEKKNDCDIVVINRLIEAGIILECEDGQNIKVHPLVSQWLVEHNKILI